MHIVALIFALIGSGGGAAIALKWIKDYNDAKSLRDLMSSVVGAKDPHIVELDHLYLTAQVWLALCALAFAAGVLAVMRKGKIAAGLLLAAGAIPAVMEPKTLLTGVPLMIAAACAFFVKPKASATATPTLPTA
jgi:hypothetical protein